MISKPKKEYMAKEILVQKASGITEPFSIEKLRYSLSKSKASQEEVNSIIDALLPRLYQGISTNKIYSEAFRLLRSRSKSHAARYYLKKGIMELGPSGYPFEKFIGEIFKHQGYTVEVGIILEGKCVSHEVDVVGKKENELILVECKYHNQAGISVDVKTPLYIHSRFEDILANGALKKKGAVFTGWIATNSKFTSDAIDYGNCKNLKLLSWNYPTHKSLRDIIDKLRLYPLTCLTSLTRQEKQWLLAKNYVLVKDVYNDSKLLKSAGVSEPRLKAVLEEGEKI